MTDNVRADWHLSNWAEYMRRGSVGVGYPSKSIGMANNSGRIHTFDDLAADVDDYSARVTDRIINDMPTRAGCAIHHHYLSSVYRFSEPVAIEDAVEQFWVMATKAGLV